MVSDVHNIEVLLLIKVLHQGHTTDDASGEDELFSMASADTMESQFDLLDMSWTYGCIKWLNLINAVRILGNRNGEYKKEPSKKMPPCGAHNNAVASL